MSLSAAITDELLATKPPAQSVINPTLTVVFIFFSGERSALLLVKSRWVPRPFKKTLASFAFLLGHYLKTRSSLCGDRVRCTLISMPVFTSAEKAAGRETLLCGRQQRQRTKSNELWQEGSTRVYVAMQGKGSVMRRHERTPTRYFI
jgi:hypothetical protein